MLKEQRVGLLLQQTKVKNVSVKQRKACALRVGYCPCSSQENLLRGDYVLHQPFLSVHQGFKPWEN